MPELDKFIKVLNTFEKERVPVDLHTLTYAFSPDSEVQSKQHAKGTAEGTRGTGVSSRTSDAPGAGHLGDTGGEGGT